MKRKILIALAALSLSLPAYADIVNPVTPTGTGTVTSVGIAPPTGFTAGAPVTTSGNVSLSFGTVASGNYNNVLQANGSGAVSWGKVSGSQIGTATVTGSNIANSTITNANVLIDSVDGTALVDNTTPLAKLDPLAAGTVVSNITGASGNAVANSVNSVLGYQLGTTQGAVAYRGASAWSSVAPGASGQVLQTNGAGANPTWENRAGNLTNLFKNPQWQILANTLNQITQVQPQSSAVYPSFTVTGSNTGSSEITFNVSGGPDIRVGDLVSLSGAGINSAIASKTLQVQSVTGSPVTSFTAWSWLGGFAPSVSQTGTGLIVNLGDLGSGSPNAAQAWAKSPTLKFWPTSFSEDIDPGSIRCLGMQKSVATQEYMEQVASPSLRNMLQGKTVTVSFRVEHLAGTGSGTASAYVNVNGTPVYGTADGNNSYSDVRITTTLPTSLSTLSFGIALNGAAGDQFYVCKPVVAQTAYMPPDYFSEVPHDFFYSTQDIVPDSLNNASITFPAVLDSTGSYYTLPHIIMAETDGRVMDTVTCEQFAWEDTSATAGASVTWRNAYGGSGGTGIIYGMPAYTQVSGQMTTALNRLPVDDGTFTNSQGKGLLYIYTPNSGLSITHGSMDVQGYCLN